MKSTVLFVCIENSCRSQMAEGFAKKWGSDVMDSLSAGSKASEQVNPRAIEYMKEKGIDLDFHHSKNLTDLPKKKWDYVITMGCGDACPFVPAVRTEDWGIPDPKHLPPDEFRTVRDQIENKVKALIDEIKTEKKS